MSHATSGTAARPVALDWRHGAIGPLAPCVLCGLPALCRSPVKNLPCHKGCAEPGSPPTRQTPPTSPG